MSLSKVCFLITVATVVAFAAVREVYVAGEACGVLAPSYLARYPAVDHTDSHASWPAYEPARANGLFHAINTTSVNVFLPVQSQNPDDLSVGKVLVASRALGDPNFAETVVVLVRSDANGVVGLILNRRTDIPLSKVLEQFDSAKGRSDPVCLGGPVETPAVFALLRSKTKLDGAEQVLGGIYLISTKSVFEKAISGRPDAGTLHVYLGYAGWSNDQLRAEVKLGSWFIFQGDAQTVFDSAPESLWRQMIQKAELRLAWSDPCGLRRFEEKRELRN